MSISWEFRSHVGGITRLRRASGESGVIAGMMHTTASHAGLDLLQLLEK